MRRLIAVVALALGAAAVFGLHGTAAKADAEHTRAVYLGTSSTLAGGASVGLDDSAANLTATFDTDRRWALMRVGVGYTYDSATVVGLTATCDIGGGTHRSLTSLAVASGAVSVYAAVHTLCSAATTACASFEYDLMFDIRGCNEVKIAITDTSGGSSDLVALDAVLLTGV